MNEVRYSYQAHCQVCDERYIRDTRAQVVHWMSSHMEGHEVGLVSNRAVTITFSKRF